MKQWNASCARCSIAFTPGHFECPHHGAHTPLWRPEQAEYASFAQAAELSGPMPLYLPWPMSPGWQVSDFGVVGDVSDRPNSNDTDRQPRGRSSATFTTTTGTSDLDGQVELTIVSEEPGVGLGSRCAHTRHLDPGDEVSDGAALIHVSANGVHVPMWMVPTRPKAPLSAAVFAGEERGRWLWLIVRPAAAALLLRDEWILADAGDFGPEAIEMPFGGPRASW